MKPGRRLEHGVAVGHPAGLLARHALQQHARLGDRQIGATELAHLGLLDAPAERVHEQLHPVADAHHRHAELEQAALQGRRARRRTPTPARRRG